MNASPSTPTRLDFPCKACGYMGGLIIKPHPKHPGLIKCGCCDSYQAKVPELKSDPLVNDELK